MNSVEPSSPNAQFDVDCVVEQRAQVLAFGRSRPQSPPGPVVNSCRAVDLHPVEPRRSASGSSSARRTSRGPRPVCRRPAPETPSTPARAASWPRTASSRPAKTRCRSAVPSPWSAASLCPSRRDAIHALERSALWQSRSPPFEPVGRIREVDAPLECTATSFGLLNSLPVVASASVA